MNYTEVMDLCQRRKVTVNDISRHIGMSYQGFRTSLDTGKMSADKITLLCKELKISPNTFFGWEKIDPVTYIDSNVQNGNNNVQHIMNTVDVLQKQLEVKDTQIAELLQIIKSR